MVDFDSPSTCGMTKPPYAPKADTIPSAAAAVRCDETSPAEECPSAAPERSANSVGIIRYVAPLPAPLAMNSTRKKPRKSQKLPSGRVRMTASAPRAMTTKEAMVTALPPNRSASLPPKGRASEPTSAPRNASDSVAPATGKALNAGNWSAMSLGNTPENPMKEPKVPM